MRRHFAAYRPNELWVSDITYVRTFSGWVYVALNHRRAHPGGSWAGRPSLICNTDLALNALEMAIWARRREGADLTGLIHHSDRGVQYRSVLLRAGPGRVRGGRLGGLQGGTPFGFALAGGVFNGLCKP